MFNVVFVIVVFTVVVVLVFLLQLFVVVVLLLLLCCCVVVVGVMFVFFAWIRIGWSRIYFCLIIFMCWCAISS